MARESESRAISSEATDSELLLLDGTAFWVDNEFGGIVNTGLLSGVKAVTVE